jgi:hypothetical protein
MSTTTETTPILVSEIVAARALGVSAGWLRKDRYSTKSVPVIRLGSRALYDLDQVRAALRARAEGGRK